MSHFYAFFAYIFNNSVSSSDKLYVPKYPYKLTFLKKIDVLFIKFFEIHHVTFYRVNFRGSYKKFTNFFYLGYTFIIKHLQYWFLPLVLLCVFLYFSLFIRSITLFKVALEWFLLLNIFYWLISGFVFFTKKYKYNRFTSAIQRFWRRSLILFWLVESSLFVVFIYLLLNASQEPVFAFDFIQLNKSRLYSWKFFIFKSFFVFLIIILSYILLVSLKWNTYSRQVNFLVLITLILTYVLWLEFYQFFYVINWYGEVVWIFDADDRVWYAESVFKRARILNHYVTICIIAKFWHIIFIYIFWVFFVLRSIEQRRLSYIALSANLQNFIILYVMNWLLMYPWFKFLFRKFLTYNHKSFQEFRTFIISGLHVDLAIFYKNMFNFGPVFKVFKKKKFYHSANLISGTHSSSKDFISTQVIELMLFINILVFFVLFLFLYIYI